MSGIKFPQTKNLFFIFFVTFIFLNLNCVVDGKSVLTDNQGGKGAGKFLLCVWIFWAKTKLQKKFC